MTSTYMKMLGVGYQNFVDENTRIHPSLVLDSLDVLEKLGFTQDAVRHIGQSAPLISARNEYGKTMRGLLETSLTLEYFVEEVIPHCYDNLFHYRINRMTKSYIENHYGSPGRIPRPQQGKSHWRSQSLSLQARDCSGPIEIYRSEKI